MENEAGEKCLQVRACVRAGRCDILLFVVGGREKTVSGVDFSRLETATILRMEGSRVGRSFFGCAASFSSIRVVADLQRRAGGAPECFNDNKKSKGKNP